MSDQPRQRPESLPEVLNVTPISSATQLQPPAKPGRKPKLPIPPIPELEMSETERQWFEFFIQSHRREYAPLTPTDEIHLLLAAVNFINALRVHQEELKSGKVISMARQHPANQMRAELDLLSFTRKARNQGKSKQDPELEQIRERLMGLSA